MIRALVCLLAVAAIAGANWATWRGSRAPELPVVVPVIAADALAWEPFATIASDEHGVRFPEALQRRAGTPVEMVGVLYPIAQLIEDGALTGAVLAPPAKFSCCGLSCEARSLSLVFIAPAGVFAEPGRKRLARISGTLRLHPEPGSWSPTEIADARIELLPDP